MAKTKFRTPTTQEKEYLQTEFKITWKMLLRIVLIVIFLFPLVITMEKGITLILIRLFCYAVAIINFYRICLLIKFKRYIKIGNYKLLKAQCVKADESSYRNPQDDVDRITFYTFKDENGKNHKTTNGTGLLHFFSRFYYFGMISNEDELYIINLNNKTIYYKIKIGGTN